MLHARPTLGKHTRMRWIEFSVKADAESAESVADLFNRVGRGGVSVEEIDLPDDLFGPQEFGSDRLVRVATFIPAEDEAATTSMEQTRQQITDGLGYLAMIRPLRSPLMEREVADEDWESAWKEHFHPHRPGSRTVVVPTWRQYEPEPEDIVVRLDPGMAFGTGLHPTTRLCVRELERRVVRGMNVLDVGTGSGILAIVASKLGAGRVVGVEIDPVAVRVARENVAANAVEDGTVTVVEGSLVASAKGALVRTGTADVGGGFDLVVANITADVIADQATALSEAVSQSGTLIGSGIIAGRFTEAVDALTTSGFRLIDAVSEGDWRAVICAPTGARIDR